MAQLKSAPKTVLYGAVLAIAHNRNTMAKRIAQNELDRILLAVAGFPEGVGLRTISKALDNNVPSQLALLIEQNKLMIDWQSRASRYRLATGTVTAVLPVIKSAKYGEVYVPLSPGRN